MGHIVILGDSVFDNASYVERGEAVLDKLESVLAPGWQVTLLARDGGVLADISRQIERLPPGATHLFVSAGGNDALGHVGVLGEPVASVHEALAMLATIKEQFQERYREMLDRVDSLRLPTTICTIYDARFPDAQLRKISNTALAVLNDVITREAGVRGLPLLDLRTLFADDADFANAIEPSARGGEKLARAILEVVAHHDFAARRSCIFTAFLRTGRPDFGRSL